MVQETRAPTRPLLLDSNVMYLLRFGGIRSLLRRFLSRVKSKRLCSSLYLGGRAMDGASCDLKVYVRDYSIFSPFDAPGKPGASWCVLGGMS